MNASGLFIGASSLSLALMNSAPAELLHPLTYAALQLSWLRPSGSARAKAQEIVDYGSRREAKKNASVFKRQRRNSTPEKPSGFSKEKPPDPTRWG